MNYLTIDRFYPRAKEMRGTFDRKFDNPLRGHSERFVWDYWHVPGEYTHLRTPAFSYFPKGLYAHFHRHLVRFGREKLGCHDISPPWLSCYVEGCRQEPHRDVPHGPLAFVYSLTNWDRRSFRGGETFLKPGVKIEPKFNRLTLFNPSITHGVREVRGTHDPREGRLVIHGWFVNPRPFWVGALSVDKVQEGLDGALAGIHPGKLSSGFGSFRLQIRPSGSVARVDTLIETFRSVRGRVYLETVLREAKFPAARGPTVLTFPLRVD